jgi:hypothetical protein
MIKEKQWPKEFEIKVDLKKVNIFKKKKIYILDKK